MAVFSRITTIDLPAGLVCEASGRTPAFEIAFTTDGEVPFPQVIVRGQGREHLVNGAAVRPAPAADAAAIDWIADGPAGLFGPGEVEVQVEGCRKADITTAGGGDWIKAFARLRVEPAPRRTARRQRRPRRLAGAALLRSASTCTSRTTTPPNWTYWDGEKDGIFPARAAATIPDLVPHAVRQLPHRRRPPHAGLSTSWSGSLIGEQLDRCAATGWRRPLCRLERRAARHRRRRPQPASRALPLPPSASSIR
ncbi:MAG: hypothetical protein U1E43_05065 [Rhodospirillales bacterium]